MTDVTTLPAAQAEALEFAALSWPERARALIVTDAATYAQAGELLTGIKTLEKEIDAACLPICEATHAAWKAATAQRAEFKAPLVDAERIIKGTMGTWYREDQRRREEEARQRAEAQRKAEEDARLAEAVQLEQAGESEVAEQVLTQPVYVAPVVEEAPKAAGVAMRERWKAECIDLRALCRAIGAGEQPPGLVEPNLVALNKMAAALKAELQIPGVRAVMTMEVAAGVRR